MIKLSGLHRAAFVLLACLSTSQLFVRRGHAAGIVGTGTSASCNEAALVTALTGGGSVSFNCGAAPATIVLTGPKVITANTSVDGANLITLDGNNLSSHFSISNNATLDVTGMNLINGKANSGGSIFASTGASLTVNDSSFSNNTGDNGGGAIDFRGDSLNVTSSTFALNKETNVGAAGGGIFINCACIATVINSTFSNNGIGLSTTGGAISAVGSAHVTIDNSTLADTSLDAQDTLESSGSMTSVTLRNSIVTIQTGNSGVTCNSGAGAVIVDGGNNLQYGGQNFSGGCGAGVMRLDPLLGALANNGGNTPTLALGAGSPAIDAGNNATCAMHDQRGVARPQGTTCDIGAFEANGGSPIAPTITNGPPPATATVGAAYTFTYNATGNASIVFAVAIGSLPPGLTLSPAGVLSGTPTMTGTFTGAVNASNGTLPDATQAFTISVGATAVAPTITNGPPPAGEVGFGFSFGYTATGSAPIVFTIASGALPPGLTLLTEGVITGTPMSAGTFTGVTSAANGTLPNATQAFSITIAPATFAPVITNGPPSNGMVAAPYGFTYTATGTTPITFTLASGALPPGLILSAAGSISGTPTAPGTYAGTVLAANGTRPDATQAFSIVITASDIPQATIAAPALDAWTFALLALGLVGFAIGRNRKRTSL